MTYISEMFGFTLMYTPYIYTGGVDVWCYPNVHTIHLHWSCTGAYKKNRRYINNFVEIINYNEI